jgi:tRNA pseudouridine55 synthase
MEHPVNKTFPWKHITREKVEETLKQFVGDIDQVPPTYSACKIEGKRAYKMRRDGEQVELKPKHIHIDSITLTSFDADKGQFAIDVVCGKGTYIRALARDIGRALDSGAYLTSLRRTRVGDITIDDCASFDHFEEWLEQNDKHNDGE